MANEFMTITADLSDVPGLRGRYTGNLAQELAYPDTWDGVNKALVENPSRTAWWATLYVFARDRRDRAKEALDDTWAVEEDKVRKAAALRDEDLKEAEVKARVRMSPAYRDANLKYLDAKRDAELLHNARERFVQRQESIVERARNYRAEADMGGQRVMEERKQHLAAAMRQGRGSVGQRGEVVALSRARAGRTGRPGADAYPETED